MEPPNPTAEMLAILLAARELIALPGNDFTWTHWEGAADALLELDALLDRLKTPGQVPEVDLELLFAPTGPLQELSMSSGWSQPYLALATRFDDVLGRS